MVFVAYINVFLLFLCVWVLQSDLYLWPNCGVFFMFHRSYSDVKYEQILEQVAPSAESKRKISFCDYGVALLYCSFLLYILERGRKINIVRQWLERWLVLQTDQEINYIDLAPPLGNNFDNWLAAIH